MEQESRRMGWTWGTCGGATELDARNQRRFGWWTIAWSVAFVVATFLLKPGRIPAGPIAWMVAIAPTLVGLGAVRAYMVFIRQADELTQRIQLEATALAFGGGVLFAMGYVLLEQVGAPSLDMGAVLVLMCLMWAAAQGLVARRYR